MESEDENIGWSSLKLGCGVTYPLEQEGQRRTERGWVLWAIQQISRQQWGAGTQGRILECHPVSPPVLSMTHTVDKRRAITISASRHREWCSYVIHPTFVAIQQAASPYWQDGLNIYVQFQESATTMLSIQTVNGFLNKMGNTWASNLMCDHWSRPILRGFNKAIFWFQQSWPKIRAQCSRWLMPWFWRQRVADVQLLTLWMTWAPHYTTKFFITDILEIGLCWPV